MRIHLRSRVGVPLLLSGVLLAAGAPPLGAQSGVPPAGSSSAASVEVVCRLEMPAVCLVRDVQLVSGRQLGDGRHEVSFDVIVGSNARWTLSVKPRPATGDVVVTPVEVRNAQGLWVPVGPESPAVAIVAGRPVTNRHAERVLFRIRSADHLAVLKLVQFEVTPTTP